MALIKPIEIHDSSENNNSFQVFAVNGNGVEDDQPSLPLDSDSTEATSMPKEPPLDETMELPHSTVEYKSLHEVLKIWRPYSLNKDNYLKGCKWSPDGTCLLTNSADNVLRVYDTTHLRGLPEENITPVLKMKEGGTIYDYCWYPNMSSTDPVSSVLASTSSDAPIHLWDAYTGLIRCTYQPINQFDEVASANSLCFSPDGSKLYSGFKKLIRIFDTALPGRYFIERNLTKNAIPQTGIISCIAVNPAINELYALGCYDKTIGLYTEPDGKLLCILNGHKGGVTHIQYSYDGVKLYSGGRKDNEILCWDLRVPGEVLFTLPRNVETNQRVYFDLIYDSYLVTGSTNGGLLVYDTKTGSQVDSIEAAHKDCINGISFNNVCSLLATSSGQRHFQLSDDLIDDDAETDKLCSIDNSFKLWEIKL